MSALESTWLVPVDLPAFAGHFPAHPIVPGVVLLDQALMRAQQVHGAEAALWQVVQAKFLSPVGPGELLAFGLQPTPRGSLAFEIHSGDRLVASGLLAAARA